jgi:hypothetical protein
MDQHPPISRTLILPQRSGRPSLHDRLLRIFDLEGIDLQGKIQELFDADERVAKIH